MSNYPEGAAHDPRALYNQEENKFIKCRLCGDGGEVVDYYPKQYSITCQTCGASVVRDSQSSAESAFENGDYGNISHCQYCHRETEGLRMTRDFTGGYHVTCTCGVSARYCDTEREAIDAWEELS